MRTNANGCDEDEGSSKQEEFQLRVAGVNEGASLQSTVDMVQWQGPAEIAATCTVTCFRHPLELLRLGTLCCQRYGQSTRYEPTSEMPSTPCNTGDSPASDQSNNCFD